VLQLGEGQVVRGIVVDDAGSPVAGARVEVRPFERPDDPQFLKMMLKIRRVEVTTGADGRFEAKGLTGERVIVTATATGYATVTRFGVELDDPDLRVELRRGAVVRGVVLLASGEPLPRFRVDTRTRDPGEGDAEWPLDRRKGRP
jgi:hypothetical protein